MGERRRRFLRSVAWRHLGLAACLLAHPILAAEPTAEEKLFDRPVAVQKLDAVEGPHPAEAITCTWYADLMIRETGTDSPGTGPAYVVRPGPAGERPVCRAAATGRDVMLGTDNLFLLGRKGPYLVFEETDANGPEPFFVRHLPEGRQIYTDQTGAGLAAVSLQGDALRLRYERDYAAPCSLLKDGAACWSRAMREGHFARAVASQPPPTDCAATYKLASGVTSDMASLIVYEVDMTLTPDGRAAVLSRGRVGCQPQD